MNDKSRCQRRSMSLCRYHYRSTESAFSVGSRRRRSDHVCDHVLRSSNKIANNILIYCITTGFYTGFPAASVSDACYPRRLRLIATTNATSLRFVTQRCCHLANGLSSLLVFRPRRRHRRGDDCIGGVRRSAVYVAAASEWRRLAVLIESSQTRSYTRLVGSFVELFILLWYPEAGRRRPLSTYTSCPCRDYYTKLYIHHKM